MLKALRLFVFAALVTACGSPPIVRSTPQPTDLSVARHVTLTLDARQQGSELVIRGTADLPDRALLDYRVADVGSGTATPSNEAVGTAAVSAGSYSVNVELKGWSNGAADVWVSFGCDVTAGQPDSIVATYGHFCSLVTGSNVLIAGTDRSVEKQTTVQLQGLD